MRVLRTTLGLTLLGLLVVSHPRSEPHVDAPAIPADSAASAGDRVPVPEPSATALDYYRSGNIIWIADTLLGFAVPAVILFTGFSGVMRRWATRIGKRWFFVIGIYFLLFSVLVFLIDLPMGYYEDFIRQHMYGLSNQTFAKWLGDSLKSLAVGVVIGFLFLWIPYLLLKKSPRRWWLYVGLLSVPFLCLTLLIQPIWIAPLFNDFGPMKDKVLEAKILHLADRAGIEGSRVYEVNKSVDTRMVNAYVTGFLGSKRIVLWDNTIAKLNEKEVLFVMGHEMGHYVLGHVWKLIGFLSALILATLFLAHLTASGLIRRFGKRFGFDELSDVASLPLIVLLINVFGFVITPIANGYSRHLEHEADRFGLEITRDNHDAATAFVKLQMENLSNPRPGFLYKVWRSDHPVLGDRIEFCNDYRPWEQGQPLKYGQYFK